MKLNVEQVIKDYEGNDLMEGKKIVTIKHVIVTALNNMSENMSVDDKIRAFNISVRVTLGGEVELSLDDRKLIKDKMGKIYAPVIIGRVIPLLEGSEQTAPTA